MYRMKDLIPLFSCFIMICLVADASHPCTVERLIKTQQQEDFRFTFIVTKLHTDISQAIHIV